MRYHIMQYFQLECEIEYAWKDIDLKIEHQLFRIITEQPS